MEIIGNIIATYFAIVIMITITLFLISASIHLINDIKEEIKNGNRNTPNRNDESNKI